MEDELVLRKKASLLRVIGYRGVCHTCNSPVNYEGEINTQVLEDNKDTIKAFVIDTFTCPHCETIVNFIMIYKSLEVTKEIQENEQHRK